MVAWILDGQPSGFGGAMTWDIPLWMRFVLVLALLGIFVFAMVYDVKGMKEAVIGFTGLGLNWFFSSSKGSTDKQEMLRK